MPLSIFGTYVQPGQVVFYPFYEAYKDKDFEYAPNELGYAPDVDYRGEYEASEVLLFLGYGVSSRISLEIEAALIRASLERSPLDDSGLPLEIEEEGIGDVEGQVRWRWAPETASRPEVFSYFETVGPTQDKGSLIGTTDWEFKLGTGLVRGFGFGTMTFRAAVDYDLADRTVGMGELAIEYLRRLSPSWRVFAAVEGAEDEWELIGEAQYHLSRNVWFKANTGVGLTSKATDWAPELGVVFSF